jgi:hypothetical protein
MSTEARRIVPPAGSIPRPWMWQVWAAVVVLFVATIGLHFALPAPLALTPPTLSFLGETCTVAFHATNHTDQPTTATLLVIIGIGTPASRYSPPNYSECARKTVPLCLAPKESRKISCEFSVAGRQLPNTAQIEIASSAVPAR